MLIYFHCWLNVNPYCGVTKEGPLVALINITDIIFSMLADLMPLYEQAVDKASIQI